MTIICRPKSRNGMAFYQRLHDELPKRGVEVVAAHTAERRKDFIRAVRSAVKARAETIVVVGGDGSQTAAVAEIANTKSALAVVPAGTGNSFALSIGIHDFETALEAIAGDREECVDVGVVNGTCFANFATVGLMATAADQTSRPLKKIIGPVAYGVSFMHSLLTSRPFQMHVTWESGELHIETYQAIVANGRYFGWQALTPDADLHSGKLAFFAVEGVSRTDALRTSAALIAGDQVKLEGAHYFSASKIQIRTKPKQQVDIDGHTLGKTPAKFKIERKALRVLVP
ncbi:MAG TPA: diacylglycerol kinase family protein [Candidatus Rubrimentiphilum sp.]|nr:diacylglycerol kinase family protein [Candidatus Rubrimentiphilum sp.]